LFAVFSRLYLAEDSEYRKVPWLRGRKAPGNLQEPYILNESKAKGAPTGGINVKSCANLRRLKKPSDLKVNCSIQHVGLFWRPRLYAKPEPQPASDPGCKVLGFPEDVPSILGLIGTSPKCAVKAFNICLKNGGKKVTS